MVGLFFWFIFMETCYILYYCLTSVYLLGKEKFYFGIGFEIAFGEITGFL